MSLACGCPETYPDWDGRDIDLGTHPAHILPMPTLLHMPLAYSLYVQRQRAEIDTLELIESWPHVVFTQTGFLGGRIIALLESAQSPSRFVTCLPAEFRVRARLHDGGIGTVRNTVRKVQSELLDGAYMPKDLLLAYLTCERCRDSRGGDKILVLRRFEASRRLGKRTPR
jgi:hypothetical protein